MKSDREYIYFIHADSQDLLKGIPSICKIVRDDHLKYSTYEKIYGSKYLYTVIYTYDSVQTEENILSSISKIPHTNVEDNTIYIQLEMGDTIDDIIDMHTNMIHKIDTILNDIAPISHLQYLGTKTY